MFGQAITRSAARFQNMANAADHPPIINVDLTATIAWAGIVQSPPIARQIAKIGFASSSPSEPEDNESNPH
jgi:hypothetical protein